jgi:hypothetical protein
MKYILVSIFTLITIASIAQGDKSKRPSPPAVVSETTTKGVLVTIDYSQPSLKGRSVGGEVAPYGEVWRTGANEATVFSITKDAKINGETLPAGKYGLYSIPGEKEWTIIFNKTWDQWGTEYNQDQDALRIKVVPGKSVTAFEKMTFLIDKTGKIELHWGNVMVPFAVE